MREDLTGRLAEAREDMAKIRAERDVEPEGGRGKRERFTGPMRLVNVRTERVSDDAVAEVLKRADLKVGEAMTQETLKRLEAAVAGVDEHFRLSITEDGQGGVTVTIVSR